MAFLEYLAGSVEAGIPLLATLEDMAARLPSRRLRRLAAELRAAIPRDGKTLSQAMADFPRAFPPLVLRTIEAGETTGRLEQVLRQLVDYLDWQQKITSQLRQATTYPIVVGVGVVGLVVLLVTVVFPRLLPILRSMDVELPLPTRIVLGAGEFLRADWPLLLAGCAGVALLASLVRRTDRGRLALDRLILRLPAFGPLVQQIHMARFVTYLMLSYQAGIGVLLALQLVERMTGNRVIARAIRAAREDIERGASIAEAFGRRPVFPPIVVRLLALGETTGRLDQSLLRAKVYYDREIPAAVNRMLAALQPMLVVALGAVILFVALAIILPILSIYQSVGRR